MSLTILLSKLVGFQHPKQSRLISKAWYNRKGRTYKFSILWKKIIRKKIHRKRRNKKCLLVLAGKVFARVRRSPVNVRTGSAGVAVDRRTLFLTKGFERIAIFLLGLHLFTTILPLIFLPDIAWQAFLAPTLEGQYIIKNILAAAFAVVVGFNLIPLSSPR